MIINNKQLCTGVNIKPVFKHFADSPWPDLTAESYVVRPGLSVGGHEIFGLSELCKLWYFNSLPYKHQNLNKLHGLVQKKSFDEKATSVDPDQTAPTGAVWSGSTLFAQVCLSTVNSQYLKLQGIRMLVWDEIKWAEIY